MAKPAAARPRALVINQPRANAVPDRHWRTRFLDHLAESSNVTQSAFAAGINVSRAYRARRTEPDFARQWRAALAEGYLHLEMEVVRRLRDGDMRDSDGEKFDFANAIRLLIAHRDAAANAPTRERDVSAAEVRESIDRKIEEIRRRMAKDKPGEPKA
jgi:hypothetical protein